MFRLLFILLFWLFVHQSLAARELSEQFPLSSGQQLYLHTQSGSIGIQSHDQANVLMTVEIDGRDQDEFDVTHQITEQGLRILGEYQHKRIWRNLKVKFTLKVPEQVNLKLHTSGGAIHIYNTQGQVKANTSGGSISVANVQGNTQLETSGGSVELSNINGQINASTSGGNMRFTLNDPLADKVEMHTSGGSITVELPEESAFYLRASTSGGRVKSEFPVQGTIKKQRIDGEINGGGHLLELHTSGGNVHIRYP